MSNQRPIKIAIAAMGGQGGGVLADWIVGMAEHADYIAQTTSVPGVAQRTGATIYYLEIFPRSALDDPAREPVMALMPAPGDVDIVLAGELVEAGRSLIRGIVTPDRTTLITSSHRDYAINEKMEMGDGRANLEKMIDATEDAAKTSVCFDMAKLAEDTGSVISSVLFGALAGAEALPFSREQFQATIERSGVAVQTNLAGFSAGFDGARASAVSEPEVSEPAAAETVHPHVAALLSRIEANFPAATHQIVIEGVRRLIDYQDLQYAGEYLNRLGPVLKADEAKNGNANDYRLTTETARYLALWMSYEDTIRVADLKTRASRFARFRKEVKAQPDQIVYVAEFMHPRVEEICDTMPSWLGELVLSTPPLRGFIGLFCGSGRRIQTTKLSGFLLLYGISAFKRWRRGTYRYKIETGKIEQWLNDVATLAAQDYALATEIAECQRLIKGYGDTHARGTRSFARIMDALDAIRGTENPSQRVRELRAAALADEFGNTLTEALKKVA